jgi:hypothetical protein
MSNFIPHPDVTKLCQTKWMKISNSCFKSFHLNSICIFSAATNKVTWQKLDYELDDFLALQIEHNNKIKKGAE